MDKILIPASKRKVPTKFQHLVLFTSDLAASSKWYQKIFRLQFSAKNHPDSSAAMRLSEQTMYFYSFGYYHHDLAFAAKKGVRPDNTSLLYFSMRLKQTESLADLKTRLEKEQIAYRKGRILQSANIPANTQAIHFLDPVNQYWIEILAGKKTTAINYTQPAGRSSKEVNRKSIVRPKHVMPEALAKTVPFIKMKWLREMVLLIPTLNGKRAYNKTEDYGVFQDSKCILSNMEQMTLIVSDLKATKKWLEAMGFFHTRTCEPEAHPFLKGHTLKCAYFSVKNHEESLVIMEHRDGKNQLISPTIQDVFHSAFELEGNRLEDTFSYWEQNKKLGIKNYYGPAKHNNSKPHGDGESGGNVAVYYYTPDYHHIEFCGDMDCVDNYEGRYGTGVRTLERDVYL